MISLLTNNDWEKSRVNGFQAKELINQKAGAAKLMQVDPQSDYPLHKHPNKTEYALVLAGNPEFEIGEEVYRCGQGDFVIFPAGVPHVIRNKGESPFKLFVGSIHLEEA